MIAADWHLAQIVLQIMTEEGVGRRLREAKAWEDEQARSARKGLGRGAS